MGWNWSYGQRSFSPRSFLILLLSCSALFLGGSLFEYITPVAEVILTATSVLVYRLWSVWEWVRLVQDCPSRKNNALVLMICVLAFGTCVPGPILRFRADRLLVSLRI